MNIKYVIIVRYFVTNTICYFFTFGVDRQLSCLVRTHLRCFTACCSDCCSSANWDHMVGQPHAVIIHQVSSMVMYTVPYIKYSNVVQILRSDLIILHFITPSHSHWTLTTDESNSQCNTCVNILTDPRTVLISPSNHLKYSAIWRLKTALHYQSPCLILLKQYVYGNKHSQLSRQYLSFEFNILYIIWLYGDSEFCKVLISIMNEWVCQHKASLVFFQACLTVGGLKERRSHTCFRGVIRTLNVWRSAEIDSPIPLPCSCLSLSFSFIFSLFCCCI